MILIADSGSTKTSWCVTDNDRHTYIRTRGINPYQMDEEEICAILSHDLLPALQPLLHYGDTSVITDVFFYGAGCTPEKSPVISKAIHATVNALSRTEVYSDMLGAARALCGRSAGLVGILGTGANSCYYDGTKICDNISPMGFILGDEGSGAYIGKRLVADIFKRQLPDDVCRAFAEETHITLPEVIQRTYREPQPNRFLAGLSPFCASHREHPAIHALLIDCFTQFFERNIVKYNVHAPIHFVGSIAFYYKDEITLAASKFGISVGTIVKEPIELLVKYHS